MGEIAQLSKTDVAPEEFYGQFLPRVVSALAAVGGAVWTMNPEGQLALQYQVNIQETRLRDSEEHQAQHGRLLYKVLSDGEGMLVPPHSGPGEAADSATGVASYDQEAAAANPTDFLLLFGLLKTDLETAGLVGNLPALRHGGGHAAGLPAVPRADVRTGRRFLEEPPVAPLLAPADALDATRGLHPHRSRLAGSPRRPPTRSPTKGGG